MSFQVWGVTGVSSVSRPGIALAKRQPRRLTDRDGRVRTFTYDAAGRKLTENWLNGQSQIIRTENTSYDAAGQLTGATDPDSTYSYTYDTAGLLTTADNQGSPGVPRLL